MSTAGIIITLVATVIVIIITVIVSALIITKPVNANTGSTVKRDLGEPRPAATPLYWSENLRNNKNYEGFPPCFNSDASAKTIFGMLQRLNYIQRYYTLIDVLSIILCLRDTQSLRCNINDVRDRLVQIVGMGGNASDEESKTKATAFIPINDTMQSKLLVAALDLCERQMKVMRADTTVPRGDADKISGHLYSFYVANLSSAYKACLGSST